MDNQVVVARRARALVIPWQASTAKLLPTARDFMWEGKRRLVLPISLDAVKLLQNLGYDAPAPILLDYDWNGTKPFDVQRDTAALLTTHDRAYVLNEIGTGKTRSALYAIDYLMRTGACKKALIVAPLSTLTPVWDQEAFDYFMHRKCAVLHGPRQKRLKLLAQEGVDIYITNHDGVKVLMKEIMARKDIDTVVIDELAVYRNARTERWKAMKSVLEGRARVWGMTGSPTPNEPTDAWAQVRLLTPGRVPKYHRQFRDQTMRQISQFLWRPKPGANDIVYRAMQPSVRFARDDCLDLPPTSYETRTVDLSATQIKVYKSIMQRLRADFEDGQVTAANEGVKLSKLLQVCAGFAYGGSGKVYDIGAPGRYSLLNDILLETERKVIIFCPFIELVQRVVDHIGKQFGRDKVAGITGATAARKRDTIFAEFQRGHTLRWLVAHPKTMAHGLTLTAANTIVWFSPTPSLEVYEQANGRITRPSQTSKTLILHIESSPVERTIFRRLRDRATMQGVLLDMFRDGEGG